MRVGAAESLPSAAHSGLISQSADGKRVYTANIDKEGVHRNQASTLSDRERTELIEFLRQLDGALEGYSH